MARLSHPHAGRGGDAACAGGRARRRRLLARRPLGRIRQSQALEEALINAIKHGNKEDPKKQVKIQATITPEQAEFIIEDQGPGFNKDDVPDPTAIENLDKPSGRGILLIEAYMTEAQWTHNGRKLRMVRKNQPGTACC